MKQKKWKLEPFVIVFYFLLYTVVALTLVFVQPFGDPPDEYSRNAIAQYIWHTGSLPNGFEESIRINSYGFSYAFQPILPYIIQALAMRFVTLFHPTSAMLFYTARLVNFTFGLLMALFVLLLSKKWFSDKRLQYLFAFLVMFLPQNIFVHTYVNTDSCCMLSIAIMLYGLTKGIQENFSIRSCLFLSVGIILCALSYYNAYGFILSCILLFIAFFLSCHNGRLSFNWKPFFQKGIFISALVLLGIGWWFIRSYILYDGDFLGLKTRDYCATLYAVPSVNPLTRETYRNQGLSVWDMLTGTSFIDISIISFICAFGPMTITTSVWIYRFYKLLFLVGILCCVLFSWKKVHCEKGLFADRPAFGRFFHLNMVFCIAMPAILSIYYSYSSDYQPQGRYILPILIPLAYYTTRGLQKGMCLLLSIIRHLTCKKPIKDSVINYLSTGFFTLISVFIAAFLLITVYGYVVAHYIR